MCVCVPRPAPCICSTTPTRPPNSRRAINVNKHSKNLHKMCASRFHTGSWSCKGSVLAFGRTYAGGECEWECVHCGASMCLLVSLPVRLTVASTSMCMSTEYFNCYCGCSLRYFNNVSLPLSCQLLFKCPVKFGVLYHLVLNHICPLKKREALKTWIVLELES